MQKFVKKLDMFRNLLDKNKPIGDVCVVSHLKKKNLKNFQN